MLCSLSHLIVWHNTPYACMITSDSCVSPGSLMLSTHDSMQNNISEFPKQFEWKEHDFESSYMLEINFSAARLPGEILNFNLSMHEAKKRLTTGLLVASLNTMAAFLTSVNCGLYTQFCTDIHCSMNKVYTL